MYCVGTKMAARACTVSREAWKMLGNGDMPHNSTSELAPCMQQGKQWQQGAGCQQATFHHA